MKSQVFSWKYFTTYCRYIFNSCSFFREDVETLGSISQTEKKCIWTTQKNLTKDKYRPVAVDEMICIKNKILKSNININSNDIFDFCCSKLPTSAITKHREGRRELFSTTNSINNVQISDSSVSFIEAILNMACQSPIMMYLASVEIPVEKDCCTQLVLSLFNDNIEEAIHIPQHSVNWAKKRKYRITGSRCYEIYTYSKDDWKTKAIKYFNPIEFSNKFTKHGLKYESRARDIFVKISKMTVVECGLVIPLSNKWLGYSPDGIIFFEDQPLYLLEIKCIFEGKIKTICEAIKNAKYVNFENGKYQLKKKHKYYGQVQMGMAVLNLSKTYFVIYASFDDSVIIMDVDFNYDFTCNMLTDVKQKYFKKMIHHCCK